MLESSPQDIFKKIGDHFQKKQKIRKKDQNQLLKKNLILK